jgi:hypothetical protein
VKQSNTDILVLGALFCTNLSLPAGFAEGTAETVIPSIKKFDQKTPFVNGIIVRRKFVVRNAYYDARTVFLRSESFATGHSRDPKVNDCFTGIRIVFPANQQFEGKSYVIAAEQEKMPASKKTSAKPTLLLYANLGGGWDTYQDETKNFAPYTMDLRFFRKTKGYLPGYLDLEIQDPNGGAPTTKIKGYFWAVGA